MQEIKCIKARDANDPSLPALRSELELLRGQLLIAALADVP